MKHQNEVYLLYFKGKGSSSQLFIVNTQCLSVCDAVCWRNEELHQISVICRTVFWSSVYNHMFVVNKPKAHWNNMVSLGARGADPCWWICTKLDKNHPGDMINNPCKFHKIPLGGLGVHREHTYTHTYFLFYRYRFRLNIIYYTHLVSLVGYRFAIDRWAIDSADSSHKNCTKVKLMNEWSARGGVQSITTVITVFLVRNAVGNTVTFQSHFALRYPSRNSFLH
jgi:hypothetical protein